MGCIMISDTAHFLHKAAGGRPAALLKHYNKHG